MTLRSIFLFAPVETSAADRGGAAYALALARKHGASLTVFAAALDVTTPGRLADASPLAAGLAAAAEAAAVSCEIVTEHSHAVGVHEVVAAYARLHDLTVSGCGFDGVLSERMVAEYLLFESGRPLIAVPPGHTAPPQHERVALAWDHTAAAARAMGDVMQLLAPAELTLLTIEGEKPVPRPLTAQASLMLLGRRARVVGHEHRQLGARSIATALQHEAAGLGTGLLAMGAFGHSSFRRFVLGGATGAILGDGPTIPVLLSH